MANRLVQLAQDLDWLGCELGHYGPSFLDGRASAEQHEDIISEKQRGLLSTAEKIQHELMNSVRFDPWRLVGVGCPVEETIDSVTEMLTAVEEIKEAAMSSVQDLPPKVRVFAGMVRSYVDTVPTTA